MLCYLYYVCCVLLFDLCGSYVVWLRGLTVDGVLCLNCVLFLLFTLTDFGASRVVLIAFVCLVVGLLLLFGFVL